MKGIETLGLSPLATAQRAAKRPLPRNEGD